MGRLLLLNPKNPNKTGLLWDVVGKRSVFGCWKWDGGFRGCFGLCGWGRKCKSLI